MDSSSNLISFRDGFAAYFRHNLPKTKQEQDDDGNPSDTDDGELFTILSELDVKRLLDGDVNTVSSVLSISNASACLLLYHYRWNVDKVVESWYEDEEKVRKAVGLLNQTQDWSKDLCQVCLQSSDEIMSAGCAHPICSVCWMKYIDTNINESLYKCLTLRCPDSSCDAAVDGDMIHKLGNESSKVKYDHFLLWSYVERRKNMKWCPAPGCDCVACYEGGDCDKNLDVTCLCYHRFCWSCRKESHSPVDCEAAEQWMEKSSKSTSEITQWILAHTKPCPKCKCPIEKIQNQDRGLIKYMTCDCDFRFCWVCLREFSKCEYKSCSGFIGIHLMEFEYMDGEKVETNMEIDNSKGYAHYYECWARNDFLRKSVLQKLIDLRSMDVKTLSMPLQNLEAYFDFMKKAWQQIAECRRVLQWINVYAYFLPENEKAKKKLSEYIQVEAGVALEKLQQCAKVEVAMFQKDYPEESLKEFRKKVIHRTNVTKIYFENLVRAFADGLDKVVGETSYEEGSLAMHDMWSS